VVILGQWSAHGEVQLSHESFELGEDLISQCVRSRDKLPLGGLVKERDIRHIFPFPVEGLEHVVNARITPLMDSDGEAHGVVVLGVEHSAQLDQAYMNPIDLVMKEAATKLALLHAHERLRYLATIDGLTGLKNHITFQRDLEEMFKRAQRAEGEICLILLDIDHFKKINDQEGHPFGDLVLREVAATLKRGTRAVDVVARYGGEEFGLALEATSLKDAVQTAERAREQVKELSFQGKKGALSVSISLGIAHYPVDAQTQKQLIELADQALYKAKALGRDRALCWGELQGELQGEPLIKGEHSSDERAMSSKELGSRASGSRPALKGLDALIRPSQDQLNAPAPPQALDSPKEEALSELKPSTSPLNTDQGASS
jgi:two-component system, cell cycle response regulator